MPYPPAHAFDQTVPATALEPAINTIAGGTGNAHTIMGTVPGLSPTAQPMPPYDVQALYNVTLSNTADDGHYSEAGSLWITATTKMDMIAGTEGSRTNPGISFPSVAIAKDTVIASATLYLTVTTTTSSAFAPGPYSVFGETPPATPAPWSGSKVPGGGAAIASVTGLSSAAQGLKAIDVTAIVQAQLNHANWESGDRINFWMRFGSDPSFSGETIGFGAVGSAPARLLIT